MFPEASVITKIYIKMKKITLCHFLILGIMTAINAQNIEIDFGIGSHISKNNFHHNLELKTDEDSGFEYYNNSNFNIGITSPIGKKNFYLRTELGFIKTNSFLSINYMFDEGFGKKVHWYARISRMKKCI